MPDTFLWFDLETFGRDARRSRIAQFAAQRTDTELNPIGAPISLFCQPARDLLPSPEAALITGITPQQAQRDGLIEAVFLARVHEALGEPGTCAVGYNSLRFDDEFLRFSLYRNFYDPYEREWRNGNSRWDIIDMVRMVYALKPEILQWPEREPGVPSFKLEELTRVNGIAHAAAHDALSDVQATIALAGLIRNRAPALYDYCWNLRSKDYALQRLDIAEHRPFLHVSSRFPARQGCVAIVAPLVRLKSNANAILVFDLSVDPTPLATLSVEEIRQRVFSAEADLPAGHHRLPLKLLHLNRTPMMAPVAMLSDQRAEQLGIDKSLCERHWHELGNVESVAARLQQVFERQYEPAEDPELALYEDFIPDADRALCERVRQAQGDQLLSTTFPFVDRRLTELLFRYRARFFPESLTEAEQSQWFEQVAARLLRKDADDYQCLEGYFRVIDLLRQEKPNDQRSQALLGTLEDWGRELQQKYSQA